ncbi:RluA family pseudouridine synthase [Aquibacillus rhizosphaerae]|uniref:Pseudouridine synthase n=1 Tax=Aquibacillus rhizosphaerae TaxID=3051431 RepID=A0ABT7L7X8_9BACI|nr:RluA family pseudouridine synthase [Aquibacillus sp. LR5S19]MDL4840696.1 RluA family pseudouridine synthase [Aquibacillus sp. LR5S19]
MNKKTKKNQATALEFTVNEQSELLPFLLEVLSNRSRNSVKSILTRGQVTINGKVITAHNHMLQIGEKVTIQKNKVAKAKADSPIDLNILYEDSDVIVIDKQPGLLSVASSKEKDVTAYRQLMTHVKSENTNNRIFIVHRLDRDTSGVMMFAKNEKVKRILQDAWKEKVEERTYIALVEGAVKKQSDTISTWLKESKTLKMYSSDQPNGGQHAVTHYKVLKTNDKTSLLEVQLETGRKNQIRVHMEAIGHPIVGDKKYGAKNLGIGRLGLHAKVLAFSHPISGKILRFESATPKVFYKLFK